jgi:hypothetical protein
VAIKLTEGMHFRIALVLFRLTVRKAMGVYLLSIRKVGRQADLWDAGKQDVSVLLSPPLPMNIPRLENSKNRLKHPCFAVPLGISAMSAPINYRTLST